MNWAEFFDMGGYAFYVWSAWGITALVMLYQIVHAKLANKKIKREIARQNARKALDQTNNQHSDTAK